MSNQDTMPVSKLTQTFDDWAIAPPDVDCLVRWLAADGDDKEMLYRAADQARARFVGEDIHLRGIIEFSNICRLNCNYCGIRAKNTAVERYRLDKEEIIELAFRARVYGYPTIVLQSGEDTTYSCDDICYILEEIKKDGPLAITLSIGERPHEEYYRYSGSGCDRYLMRFETSDPELFSKLHPDDNLEKRLGCLEAIRAAGIQLGSGFLIGLPGAGLEGIARDLLFATKLQLDMIGCGPFIPSPGTPLADAPMLEDRDVYYKAIAILRLLNPYAHIPATTAFDAIFKDGRNRVLTRGANVFMPNITPQRYRPGYQLYPNKPCIDEDGDQCALCTRGRVHSIGRKIAADAGHSMRPDWIDRVAAKPAPSLSSAGA